MVNPSLSIVIIGSDKSHQLQSCVASVRAANIPGLEKIVYVDSQSQDDSVACALAADLQVVELNGRACPARARNAGLAVCDTDLILFLDADMTLSPRWPAKAIKLFDYEYIAAVSGHIKAIHPRQSVYNRVVDLDSYSPAGTSDYCSGNAMMRRQTLLSTRGFDESLPAGEDIELCNRIRCKGGVIFNNGEILAAQQLEKMSFRQYWKRLTSSGWTLAEVSSRFAKSELPVLAHETRHNLLHVFVLAALLTVLVAAVVTRVGWLSVTALTLLTCLVLRTIIISAVRSRDPLTRFLYGLHVHFMQIPIAWGQLRYYTSARRGPTT